MESKVFEGEKERKRLIDRDNSKEKYERKVFRESSVSGKEFQQRENCYQSHPFLQISLLSVGLYFLLSIIMYILLTIHINMAIAMGFASFILASIAAIRYPTALPCPSLLCLFEGKSLLVGTRSTEMGYHAESRVFTPVIDIEEGTWVRTMWTCVMVTVIAAFLLSVGAGYHFREIQYLNAHTTANKVSATDTPDYKWGSIYFSDDVHVARLLGGGSGTCAAPIIQQTGQTKISFWALSDEYCCEKSPPTCSDWSLSGKRAVVIGNLDWFPSTSRSIESLKVANGLQSATSAMYVRWIDPDEFRTKRNQSILIWAYASLGVLFVGIGMILLMASHVHRISAAERQDIVG